MSSAVRTVTLGGGVFEGLGVERSRFDADVEELFEAERGEVLSG